MRTDMTLIILVAVLLGCLATAAGMFLSSYITL